MFHFYKVDCPMCYLYTVLYVPMQRSLNYNLFLEYVIYLCVFYPCIYLCVFCANCNSSQKGMQKLFNSLFYSLLKEPFFLRCMPFLISALYSKHMLYFCCSIQSLLVMNVYPVLVQYYLLQLKGCLTNYNIV